MKAPLLEIEHLSTWIGSKGGIVRAVDDLSLDIGRGRPLPCWESRAAASP